MQYTVRLTKVVKDVVQAFATVDASSEDEAREKALALAKESDLNWQWKDSLPGSEDLEANDATPLAPAT